MFTENYGNADIIYLVKKRIPGTDYRTGTMLYGDILDRASVKFGLWYGTKSPRIYSLLNAEALDKLLTEGFITQIK